MSSSKPSVSANPFSVLAQYVKDVSFENLLMGNPNAPEISFDDINNGFEAPTDSILTTINGNSGVICSSSF